MVVAVAREIRTLVKSDATSEEMSLSSESISTSETKFVEVAGVLDVGGCFADTWGGNLMKEVGQGSKF